MNKILISAILLGGGLLAAACAPCRQLAGSQQDSIRVETVVRTEYVPDTIFWEVPSESTRQTVRDTVSRLETSLAISEARITSRGELFHSLENKVQTRQIPVKKEIVYRDSLVYRDQTNTEIVEVERKLSWWQQTQMKGFWVALAVIVLILRKNIFSIVKSLFNV